MNYRHIYKFLTLANKSDKDLVNRTIVISVEGYELALALGFDSWVQGKNLLPSDVTLQDPIHIFDLLGSINVAGVYSGVVSDIFPDIVDDCVMDIEEEIIRVVSVFIKVEQIKILLNSTADCFNKTIVYNRDPLIMGYIPVWAIECETKLTRFFIRLKNPEHLINFILKESGKQDQMLDPFTEASLEEIKRKLLLCIKDFLPPSELKRTYDLLSASSFQNNLFELIEEAVIYIPGKVSITEEYALKLKSNIEEAIGRLPPQEIVERLHRYMSKGPGLNPDSPYKLELDHVLRLANFFISDRIPKSAMSLEDIDETWWETPIEEAARMFLELPEIKTKIKKSLKKFKRARKDKGQV